MGSHSDADRYLLIRTKAESERVWLRDLAGRLPKTCRFDGFDISMDQVPDRPLFPTDINYYTQDMLEPFPAEFRGQYDAVHVRLLVMGLKAGEWELVIRNLITLLRPGGYLQWTDIAVLDGVVIPGVLGCNVDDANRFLNQFKQIVSSHGKSGKSVTELFPHFKKCGLKDCRKDIAPLDKPEYKDMLNANYVKAISHILQASLQPSQGCRDALSMDQITRLGKLTLKNLQETNSSLRFSLHVVIGRRE
ncbi:hypothetical protein BDDG_06694 [Blastomyces dermatitidis ATCC 18188]|uniref:Uncharacterized protein n=1 Tax=Ajellomyces dermatitidis (strain ATCC 18188 / CBS 674.68) TaxID=653446 RepID=F2TKI6_AJEDA|nr:hypothetical protein BDDG_06694 [Blastomyces dermatitidis ATCC 18188]